MPMKSTTYPKKNRSKNKLMWKIVGVAAVVGTFYKPIIRLFKGGKR